MLLRSFRATNNGGRHCLFVRTGEDKTRVRDWRSISFKDFLRGICPELSEPASYSRAYMPA